MKMDRVIVAAFIFHRDSVALTFLYNQRLDIRPRFAVDGPAIEAASTPRDFFKDETNALIGLRMDRVGAEDGIIPAAYPRFCPLWSAALPTVFDDDPNPHFAQAV